MESAWMITIPLPALLLLIACTVVLAVLHRQKEREVKKAQLLLGLAEGRLKEARRLASEEGLITGLKRGYAEMYLSVVKAHRAGKDPVVAAARVARMNANYLLGETAEPAEDRALIHGGIPSNHV